ncbi:hypothetical protein GCM10010435_90840 [Winogradskya consettensis]|uniref:Uncharacterized protein n=1 Tax=Winogradskya consettensis TaxID=113560 RepID=A0A919VR32_9ACTN|nr:hypothetical protein Aco04nite_34410 [Actinoplanes consettensis]
MRAQAAVVNAVKRELLVSSRRDRRRSRVIHGRHHSIQQDPASQIAVALVGVQLARWFVGVQLARW